MGYEDLILSMLLNKIHLLATYQPKMAPKVLSLLNT
jgi:hypothetical protein